MIGALNSVTEGKEKEKFIFLCKEKKGTEPVQTKFFCLGKKEGELLLGKGGLGGKGVNILS